MCNWSIGLHFKPHFTCQVHPTCCVWMCRNVCAYACVCYLLMYISQLTSCLWRGTGCWWESCACSCWKDCSRRYNSNCVCWYTCASGMEAQGNVLHNWQNALQLVCTTHALNKNCTFYECSSLSPSVVKFPMTFALCPSAPSPFLTASTSIL